MRYRFELGPREVTLILCIATTAALVVDREGRVSATDSLSAFVGGHPLPTAIEFDLHEELQ